MTLNLGMKTILKKMNKKEVDEYFVNMIPMLEKIVKGVSYKNNKKIDTHAAINEGYLHIIKNIEKINTTKELEKMAVNFVNMNIIWNNSQLCKQEIVNNTETFYNTDEEKDDQDINGKPITKTYSDSDLELELEQKIEIEKWYDEKKCILQLYRDQEINKQKQIIFDCYFKKNITKGTALAKHLRVNKDYGCLYIRELKKDINDYYQSWKKNNNIKK